jgi:dihydrodipicolinate synthase/N-acetylneuraminate lyase
MSLGCLNPIIPLTKFPKYLLTLPSNNAQLMQRKPVWVGIYPAVTTKFTSSGALDIATFLRNIQAQVEAGVQGIIIGGSLGESSTITHEERLTMLQAVLDGYGEEVDVILNVAEGSTVAAIDLAQKAQAAGAHGLMLLPPMMYKPTDSEVADFFVDVAKSTDLSILVYNNPVDYKIEITLDIFEQLAAFPNIAAVKESTRITSNVIRMRNRFGNRFQILCGVDTIALEALLLGADGWVAGLVCAFPKETVALYRLVLEGRLEEAKVLYQWFMPLLELDISPQLVQNIKLAETYTGLGTEYVRPPRKPLLGAERERVQSIIEHAMANLPL